MGLAAFHCEKNENGSNLSIWNLASLLREAMLCVKNTFFVTWIRRRWPCWPLFLPPSFFPIARGHCSMIEYRKGSQGSLEGFSCSFPWNTNEKCSHTLDLSLRNFLLASFLREELFLRPYQGHCLRSSESSPDFVHPRKIVLYLCSVWPNENGSCLWSELKIYASSFQHFLTHALISNWVSNIFPSFLLPSASHSSLKFLLTRQGVKIGTIFNFFSVSAQKKTYKKGKGGL